MTKEEILAMPAGRALDVLVACRVTGAYTNESVMLDLAKNGELDPKYGGDPGIGCRDDDVFMIGPPLYSTDIAAAWEVLRKIRGLLWLVELDDNVVIEDAEGRACPSTDDAWRCTLIGMTMAQPDEAVVVEARGAPLAICRAALLAVEAETALAKV